MANDNNDKEQQQNPISAFIHDDVVMVAIEALYAAIGNHHRSYKLATQCSFGGVFLMLVSTVQYNFFIHLDSIHEAVINSILLTTNFLTIFKNQNVADECCSTMSSSWASSPLSSSR
jgi:hypothetical protein